MMTTEGAVVTRIGRRESDAPGNDSALIRRSIDGDTVAFEALMVPRLGGMYRTAFAILRHEADARDAVQDASVRAWRHLHRLRDYDKLDRWLSRILVNACRAQLESRRRSQVREIDLGSAELGNRSAELAEPAMSQRVGEVDAVRRAFLRLSPGHRVLLALHHGQERSIEDIANLLGAPRGTIKWRLHRARRQLALALEREQ